LLISFSFCVRCPLPSAYVNCSNEPRTAEDGKGYEHYDITYSAGPLQTVLKIYCLRETERADQNLNSHRHGNLKTQKTANHPWQGICSHRCIVHHD